MRLDNLIEGNAYKKTCRSKNGEDKERKELEETTICLKGNSLIEWFVLRSLTIQRTMHLHEILGNIKFYPSISNLAVYEDY